MKINEVEKSLGIPRETIRYYILSGLLEPERLPNGYRNYREEDIRQLKRILILRDLGIGITEIREIFSGARDFGSELKESKEKLIRTRSDIENAISLCEQMMKIKDVSFDPDEYFERKDS